MTPFNHDTKTYLQYIARLEAEIERLWVINAEMLDCLEQLVDDMRDGLCVCEAAKEWAIAVIAKATPEPAGE